MNDSRKVFSEHLPQLLLYFSLYEALNHRDGVKRAADFDVLERVGLEYQCASFLFGENEDDVGIEVELREAKEHGYDEWLMRRQDPSRSADVEKVRHFAFSMVQWICLPILNVSRLRSVFLDPPEEQTCLDFRS